jgi:hypothetical protein
MLVDESGVNIMPVFGHLLSLDGERMKKITTILLVAVFSLSFSVGASKAQIGMREVSKDKLDNFDNKVNDWFNEIDSNLDNGINEASLTNKENEVVKCLKENDLGSYELNFDKQFRNDFLSSCGLAVANSDDFYKFSRFRPGKITLNNFWKKLLGNYNRFYELYKSGSPHTNFANVEMPVKVLKLYLHR